MGSEEKTGRPPSVLDPRQGDPRAPGREEPKAVRVCRLATVEGHPPSIFPLPVSFVPEGHRRPELGGGNGGR